MCLVCILSLLRALLVVVREMARYRLRRVPGIGVLRHERVCTVCSYTETDTLLHVFSVGTQA